MLKRLYNKCLISPGDLEASLDQLEVIGAFNPGAVAIDDKVVLLVRVSEQVREKRAGFTALPRYGPGRELAVDWITNDDLVFLDSRVVQVKSTGLVRLTFVSHLRVFHSSDGRSVDSETGARFMPEAGGEEFGVEDARITKIDGRYYFTYVAVSHHGVTTALAGTKDFETFERYGTIFHVENKDVVLFPEKIAGQYAALHRPNCATPYTAPEMWLASSPDLIHWGQHEPFMAGESSWETGRIGAGTPPIKTDQGWVEIYHGNDKNVGDEGVGMYSAGVLLLDLENPQKILRSSRGVVLKPETEYEREGFVPNVLFPTGVVDCGETWLIYYGAADTCTAVVEVSVKELLEKLK